MNKNYERVPEWWFMSILVLMTILAIICCEGFGKQLQLPWWGVLLSLTIALVFTLPVGVIQATTNQVIFCLKPLFPKGKIIFRLSNTSRN
jgi:ABC-type proline/glycine betaine transport system permease subunit